MKNWLCIALFSASLLPRASAEWQPVGPFGGSVQAIAVDPHHPATLLAGARNGLLFRSDDGAKSWRRLSFGRTILGTIQTLAIDRADANHYWAGVSGEDANSAGLWESTDQGAHWRPIAELAGISVEALVQWAKDSKVMAAGTRSGVYEKSKSNEWTRISPRSNAELQDVTAITIDPSDAKILYAGTPHLPWKTVDGGATWRSVRRGMLDDSDVFSIYINPARPQQIFSSACSGIYRSENAGDSWTLLDGIPGTSRRTHIIVQDPRQPMIVYAGTTTGLYKSWDGGTRWNPLNKLQVNSLAFDPGDSRTLYLATEHEGVLMTRDGGETLTPMNEGLLVRNISSVTDAGSRLFASAVFEGEQSGVYASTIPAGSNNAKSPREWQKMGDPAAFGGGNIRSLTSDQNGQVLFAATAERIYRSSNRGGSWQSSGSPFEHTPAEHPTNDHAEIRALQLLPDGTLLTGTARGLFRLRNATAAPTFPRQWEELEIAGHARLSIQAIFMTTPMAGTRFVGIRTEMGIFVMRLTATANRGAVARNSAADHRIAAKAKPSIVSRAAAPQPVISLTWKAVPITDDAGSIYDAAVSCSGVVLAAASQGLRRFSVASPTDTSGNVSNNLEDARGIPPGTVRAVAFHPTRCQDAYATQFGTTYVSHDSGGTWSAIAETTPGGYDNLPIDRFWIMPSLPQRLFALVPGEGIFSRDLDKP